MRVVHVIDRLGVGGAEMLLLTAAGQAARLGWELTVVSLGDAPDSPVPDRLRALGVRIVELPSGSGRTLLDGARFQSLRQALGELSPQVVHTHLAYSTTLAPLALAGTRTPVVSTLHAPTSRARRGQAVRDALEARVLRRLVDVRLGVGPSVCEAQQARVGRPVEVLENPVDLRDPGEPERVTQVRAELLGDRDGPVVLAVGRLTDQKAFGDLVDAFAAHVLPRHPGAVLALAGRGHLRDELEAQVARLGVADAVRFLGPRPDVPFLLRASDVFAMSSSSEGLPLSLLEAMAAGLPSVVTDVGDVAHALGHGGVVVPARRPAELGAALAELLDDPERCAQLGKRAAERVRERHCVERWADDLDAVYRRVVRPCPRVALLTHGYYPRIGGIERQRGQVTPRLVRGGTPVVVVTRGLPGSPRRELVEGVPVVRTPAISGRITGSRRLEKAVWQVTRPVDSVLWSLSASATLLRLRPDIIQSHEFISTTRVALGMGRVLRRPVIALSHRSGPLGDVGRHVGSPAGERMLARLRERAALVVGVSTEIDAELAGLGFEPERRMVIHNGVDTERFRPAEATEKAALRAELGIPDGVVVIFIGRLMPEKRVDLLLDVWRGLALPGATLLVIGSGDERERLTTLLPPGARLVGAVDDTAPWLRASDVFVLPSVAEGLSNALLEAQACGLACLVTDVGAAREVVTDGDNGIILPVDDRAALAERLRTVTTDPAVRVALGSSARHRSVAEFSIEATVAAFRQAYDRVERRRACSAS